MKKLTFLTVALASSTILVAQNTSGNSQTTGYIPCAEFHETIPVRDMPLQTDEDRAHAAMMHEQLEAIREERREKLMKDRHFVSHGENQVDPVLQQTDGTMAITAPLVNFDGETDASSCPPDPNGAVGPTQFVQAINSSYQVYNKTGTALTGVVDLKTLFSGSDDDGDPVVLYDKFADRWVITEFNVMTSPVAYLVAVSKTNDATGAYYTYKFTNSAWTPGGSGNWIDYPKYSIWTDGYYMTGQIYPEFVITMDRARMLAGKASAGYIMTTTPTPPVYFGANNSLYSAAKTLDCDASALPPYGTPEFMTFFENTNSGGYSNSIVFMKCVHDTAAKTLTITRWDSLSPSTFNAYFSGGSEKDISQPSSSKSLDALDGTFNFRVSLMVFTGYNSVVMCNTVNTGSSVAGIRWYEIRQDPSTYHFSIYQQGTYAPSDGNSRWNGDICMDNDGDIALSYSVSSGTVYPSIKYTGRLVSDAINTMTGTEQTAITGTTPYVNCGNRWGDYSDMTLDPTDGLTFWVTNEYDKGGNEASRIFSFTLASTVGIAPNPIDNAVFKVYQTNNYLNVIASNLPSNDQVQVDLFDMVGKQISTRKVTPSGDAINEQVSVSGLATGVYFVRIGNLNYQRVFKVEVNR